MEPTGKRTISVTVKMSESDFRLLTAAAARLWPKALLTNSSRLLGLAKLKAETILNPSKKRAPKAKKPKAR